MQWYAESPTRRTRQVIADLLVLGWVLLWVAIGQSVHALVQQLAAPADPLRAAGSGVQTRMTEISATIGDTPLVGDRLTAPFDGVASAGGSLVSAGDTLESGVNRVAMLLALLTALVPIVLVVGVYVVARVLVARRVTAMARFRETDGGLELLALRALVHQTPARLVRVTADPVGAWRGGDQVQISALAALELSRLGLRTTGPQ